MATEAFAFLVAGPHTTYGSLVMLVKHILDRSDVRGPISGQLDETLPSVPAGVYPYRGLEAKLPYLSAAMKGSFCLTPIFQFPLPRVIPVGGPMVASHHLPGGMIASAVNSCIGHSIEIWGRDLEVFKT